MYCCVQVHARAVDGRPSTSFLAKAAKSGEAKLGKYYLITYGAERLY